MSALFEIKATDWNGKTLDGNPFELVGVTDSDRLSIVQTEFTEIERTTLHADLATALTTGEQSGRLKVTSGDSSDYGHFEISDPKFNLGKSVTYGPGDYVLLVSKSLALWLPGAVVKALNPELAK